MIDIISVPGSRIDDIDRNVGTAKSVEVVVFEYK